MRLVRTATVTLMAQMILTGCSTQQIAQFETNVASSRCAKFGGYAKGSEAHRQCVAADLAEVQQEKADSRAVLLGVASASAEVWSAEQQGRAAASANSAPYGHRVYSLQSSWWNAGKRMCRYADGSILNVGNGTCPREVTASR